jgi:hypothetical protein
MRSAVSLQYSVGRAAGAADRDGGPGHVTGRRHVVDTEVEVGQGEAQQRDAFPEVRSAAHRTAGRMINEVRGEELVENGQPAAVEPFVDQPSKDALVLGSGHRSRLGPS